MEKLHLLEFLETSEEAEEQTQEELLKHHLDDIKEALMKAFAALKKGDIRELLDNIAILQSGAFDVEELITHEKPEV